MIKIYPRIMAAISATQDRKYINRYAAGKIKEPDRYYNILVSKSGPKAVTIKSKISSWIKAYNNNMERINLVERIEAQFKSKK
ncbi:MAG: hypothetical protein KH301_06120 [Brachyspira sp.]|nr:hypothetical protein [Brachyspira sp.]